MNHEDAMITKGTNVNIHSVIFGAFVSFVA